MRSLGTLDSLIISFLILCMLLPMFFTKAWLQSTVTFSPQQYCTFLRSGCSWWWHWVHNNNGPGSEWLFPSNINEWFMAVPALWKFFCKFYIVKVSPWHRAHAFSPAKSIEKLINVGSRVYSRPWGKAVWCLLVIRRGCWRLQWKPLEGC